MKFANVFSGCSDEQVLEPILAARKNISYLRGIDENLLGNLNRTVFPPLHGRSDGALEEQRRAADRLERAHRRVHAAGDVLERLLEEARGCLGVHSGPPCE